MKTTLKNMIKFSFIVFLFVFFSLSTIVYADNKNYYSDLEDIINIGKKKESSFLTSFEYQEQLSIARSYVYRKNYQKAIATYFQLEEKYGSTFDASLGLANVAWLIGDVTDAKNILEDIKKQPKLKDFHHWFMVYYRLSQLEYNNARYEKFIEYLTEIITSEKNNQEPAILAIAFYEGFDQMVKIFTTSANYAYPAYRELGAYLLLNETSIEDGLRYSMVALAMMVHWGIDNVLKTREIDFVFTGVDNFFDRMLQFEEGRQFLRDAGAARIVYVLRYYFSLGERVQITEHRDANFYDKRKRYNFTRYTDILFSKLKNNSIVTSLRKNSYYPIFQF